MMNLRRIVVFRFLMLASNVLTVPPDLDVFSKFHQNDYKLKFERLEVVSYNKHLMNQFEIVTFKYNRTWAVSNFTINSKIDIGNKLEIISQSYKFMSNEYRYFPVRLQVNYCFAVSKDLLGVKSFFQCGHFPGCPLIKDTTFRMCNWAPDESKFPPLIPDGKYMSELQMRYESTEIAVLRGYGEVYRPITIFK